MLYDTIDFSKEWIKCKFNPFYFIYNYVYISTPVNSIKLSSDMLCNNMKRVITLLMNSNDVLLKSNRQNGSSTLAACMIVWASVFYPKNTSIILNHNMHAGLHNLKIIKFIISHLPTWMLGEGLPELVKTQFLFKLSNGSKIYSYFPATSHTMSTIAKSLETSILYIDCQNNLKMNDLWNLAKPVLMASRENAVNKNLPYFVLSSESSDIDDDSWFQNKFNNAIDSDLMFDDNNDLLDKPIIISENNGFVKVCCNCEREIPKVVVKPYMKIFIN